MDFWVIKKAALQHITSTYRYFKFLISRKKETIRISRNVRYFAETLTGGGGRQDKGSPVVTITGPEPKSSICYNA